LAYFERQSNDRSPYFLPVKLGALRIFRERRKRDREMTVNGEARGALSAGAAVGLLLGLVMGLSISPVVGVVLGALSAGLLALLGFQKEPASTASSWRIAAFGFSCVLGLLFGITTRTHWWITPSPEQELARWKGANFTDDQARQLVLYNQTGIAQKDWTFVTQHPAGGAGAPVLFASDSSDDCGYLTSTRFPDVSVQLQQFINKQGAYKDIAAVVKRLPETNQRELLDAALALRCQK
jgi:hypothetical protein